LATLRQADFDLIWGIGAGTAAAIEGVAPNNPDQKFAIVDYSAAKDERGVIPENLLRVRFRQEEAYFLQGVIAAKSSKAGAVGFLGGVEDELTKEMEYGFRAGVIAVDPKIQILSGYAASTSDSSRGKALANSIYAQGADVIYNAAGEAGKSVEQTALENSRNGKQRWVIAADLMQVSGSPETSLCSLVKSMDKVVFEVTRRLSYGEWKGGEVISFGLKEGGFELVPAPDKASSPEVISAVEHFKEKLISGEFSVPKTKAEFASFLGKLPK